MSSVGFVLGFVRLGSINFALSRLEKEEDMKWGGIWGDWKGVEWIRSKHTEYIYGILEE